MSIIENNNKNKKLTKNKKLEIILYLMLCITLITIITVLCLRLVKYRKITVGDIVENYSISYELINDNGNEVFKIVSVNKYELPSEVVIPESIFGITVSSIDSLVFDNCTSLKSIVIPNSITSIGDSVLRNCTSLKKITIPFVGEKADGSGATHFGYIFGAVDYLENETKVPYDLKEVVVTNASIIASNAFFKCYRLTSVVISDSVTQIGVSSFEKCRALEKITIPFVGEKADGSGATHFGYIFGTSDYLAHNGYVPKSLKEVVITSAKNIGDNAFYNCDSITSITIPDTVLEIGNLAFCSCDYLQNIIIPSSVKSIGDRAFSMCSSITDIIIPDSVSSIGCGVFDRCDSLKKITLPFVGEKADGSGATHFGYIFNVWGESSNKLDIPASLKEVVITKATIIGDYAFYDCTKIENIIIPSSVQTIGTCAFYNCESLKKIIIPISVIRMGKDVFSYNSELTIYCEVGAKPVHWIGWSSGCSVVWGYSN